MSTRARQVSIWVWSLVAIVLVAVAGQVFGLLGTAAPGDMDYVNDQRSQLDLAVRMSIVAFMATGLTVLFLARHGIWLLVALFRMSPHIQPTVERSS
jgi:hypothetical protein